MKNVLKLAFEELGTKEIPGSDDNQRIVDYASESGISGVEDDETPWCSIFVNWVCHKLGLEKSDKPNARSWAGVGKEIFKPKPGDIVVFWRESPTSWKGHVAFFLGYSGDLSQVYCIGGNQGNAVSIAAYDASKVLHFQRVSEVRFNEIPKPTLKRGVKGVEVEKLQLILNEMGFDCGDADGVFGGKSEQAFKYFQARHGLVVDGVYGTQGATTLNSIMQT